MDWNSEIIAAWAQAVLSALAIVASVLFAVWLPRHEKHRAGKERQLRSARTLLWAHSVTEGQWKMLKKEVASPYMRINGLSLFAAEARALADEVRAVRHDDLPLSGVDVLWKVHVLVRASAEIWGHLYEARRTGRDVAMEDMSELEDMVTSTKDALSKLKIGRRILGNPFEALPL